MANSFINKKADLTTTDLTTLYTVPSFKTAVVKSLIVSEDAGSGSTITITLVNASSAIFNLFKDKAIASKSLTCDSAVSKSYSLLLLILVLSLPLKTTHFCCCTTTTHKVFILCKTRLITTCSSSSIFLSHTSCSIYSSLFFFSF